MSAKQPSGPPPGSRKPEPPPASPTKTEALWSPAIARDPVPAVEAIVAAARAFVRAWAETGRGSVLLPECVEGHAFDLVRAVHAAYPPASDPYSPSAPKPPTVRGGDPPDLARLWNDAVKLYRADNDGGLFEKTKTATKLHYFERAVLDTIARMALDGYVDKAAPTVECDCDGGIPWCENEPNVCAKCGCDVTPPARPTGRPDAETAAVLRAAWTLCNNTEGGSRPARGREVERLSEALTDWECEHGEIHGPHGWNLPAKDDEGAEPDSWSFDPPDGVGGGSFP